MRAHLLRDDPVAKAKTTTNLVRCRCPTIELSDANRFMIRHLAACRHLAWRSTCILGCRFHVRDLIGHGELQRVHTTSGPLLRAVKRN